MGNREIDEQILAVCEERWRKVALVVAKSLYATGLDDKPWAGRTFTRRLFILAKKRQVEIAGNIYNWRASEVRLTPKSED